MTAPDRPGGVDASDKKRRPPRLLVKTTIAVTLVTMALLLVVVFVVTLSVRDRVREGVAENLESSQRMFATLEARRQRELRAQAVTLSESPTLKAALDTYVAELKTSDQPTRAQLLTTIANELEKLAERFEADAIVLVDTHQSTLAAAGRDAHQWLSGRTGERHFERRRPGQLRRGGSCRQQRVSSRLGAAAAQRRRHDRYALPRDQSRSAVCQSARGPFACQHRDRQRSPAPGWQPRAGRCTRIRGMDREIERH